MGSVWFALRADLRLRWRAMLGLALLLGLIGGAVLTAAAGARRTETAYPRLLQWAHASQVTIVPGSRELGLTATGTGRTGFYAALGHLPQVEAVSTIMLLGMAVVVRHGPPDMNATTEGSLNGAVGVSVDRVQVLAGHLFNRADRKAVMIDQRMAALTHLRPGGILHVLAIPGFTTTKPDLEHEVPLAFRVSAIVRFDTGIVPADAGSAHPQALFSPAFIREVVLPRFPWLGTSDYAGVRLRPGASMTSFVRRVNVLLNRFPETGKAADIGSNADGVSLTERAMRPEAVALALFAALAGSIALAILSQLLSRQLILDSAEFPVLRALGMARWKLITASLARVGAVTAAGGLLGVGIAIAASPLMPLGLARLAEPSPGLEINLAILGAGLAAAAILPLVLVAPVAVRAHHARGRPG